MAAVAVALPEADKLFPEADTLFPENDAVPPDSKYLLNSFTNDYDTVTKSSFFFYPLRTFIVDGIPMPAQYFKFKRLMKLFGEHNDFLHTDLTANLTASDLRTDRINLVDNYGQVFNEKKMRVTIVSGYFFHSVLYRREKIVKFIREKALAGHQFEIFTQDHMVPGELFTGENAEIIKKFVKIHVVLNRINIHYIILENMEDPEDTDYLIDFPHTELDMFRLTIRLKHSELKESFNVEPEKLRKFLENLRRGCITLKPVIYLKWRIRNWVIDHIIPDFWVAVDI
jgi:hypothetical protein